MKNQTLDCETLKSQRGKSKAVQIYKVLNDLAPAAFLIIICLEVMSHVMNSKVPVLRFKCISQV